MLNLRKDYIHLVVLWLTPNFILLRSRKPVPESTVDIAAKGNLSFSCKFTPLKQVNPVHKMSPLLYFHKQ